jgi:hypothetical protein
MNEHLVFSLILFRNADLFARKPICLGIQSFFTFFILYTSGLQPGLRVLEDILGGMRKHLTGYVKMGEK